METWILLGIAVLTFVIAALRKFWIDFDCMHQQVHDLAMTVDEIGYMLAHALDAMNVEHSKKELETNNSNLVAEWDNEN